ncbi:uncharacterized protein LOC113352520 [Papaver somniferum]|uniref:uncharacterized protein LOC113352520 n=1 Tax=Papaver somniferum TaxID=3469 RepID=UPI000E6F911D|nr:uncharacterized protein LOC113352520 [Papaver somniferum]
MDTSQRIKIFIWKCLQDALPTKTKIKSFINEDNNCVFCQSVRESTYHLFFECAYARAVWNLPPMPSQGVHLTSNSVNKSFLDHYNDWKTGNLQSISMALEATKCWFIWKERCLRVFENKNRTPEQLTIDITRHFAYWHPENRKQNKAISSKKTIRNINWTLPSTNTNKINSDASWLSEITNTGFGFILRNWTGTFQAATVGSCRTFSPEEVEAVAHLRATQWVVTNKIQHLVIEGDNQTTINYLQGKESTVQWQCLAMLEEVKLLADQLVSFLGFQYVDRRANKVADLLAKKGRSTNTTTFWNDPSPSFLIPSIAFDTVKACKICNLNDNISVISQAGVNPKNSVIGRATQHE